MARVACEAAASDGLIAVLGEITTTAYFDAYDIARDTLEKIGYTDSKYCLGLQDRRHYRFYQKTIARHRPGRETMRSKNAAATQ